MDDHDFTKSICLVVEPYPSEKYDFVSWENIFPIYGKIKLMFQTTNQVYIDKIARRPRAASKWFS
jgi:hypothetical protein